MPKAQRKARCTGLGSQTCLEAFSARMPCVSPGNTKGSLLFLFSYINHLLLIN